MRSPIRSVIIGAAPLYGMCVASTLASDFSSSADKCCVLPMPAEPYDTAPLRSFMYLISSPTLATGSDLGTSSTLGTCATLVMDSRWVVNSYGRFLYSAAAAVWPTLASSRVYPSAGALAVRAAPTVPPAPGLLSTMTGCDHSVCNWVARARATRSVVPPGVNGAISVTGLVGQASVVCAAALAASVTPATARQRRRRVRVTDCIGKVSGQWSCAKGGGEEAGSVQIHA